MQRIAFQKNRCSGYLVIWRRQYVIPAEAGIQSCLGGISNLLDPGFRRGDRIAVFAGCCNLKLTHYQENQTRRTFSCKNMIMSKYVLFDVDGTIIDSGRSGFRALNLAFKDLTGIEDGFQGMSFAGKTDLLIVKEALHRHEIGLENGRIEVFLNRYLEHLQGTVAGGNGHVQPGVRLLLETLTAEDGIFLGLLTGNIEEGARTKLQPFFLNHYFPVGAYGGDGEDRNDLLPIAVTRLAEVTNVFVDYTDCVVVGDTPSDAACARVHGARSIAVATGPFSIEVLQQTSAGLVLNDLSDTLKILDWLKEG